MEEPFPRLRVETPTPTSSQDASGGDIWELDNLMDSSPGQPQEASCTASPRKVTEGSQESTDGL